MCGAVNDIYWFAVCAASVMSVLPWPSAAVTKLVECGRRALKALAVLRELVCDFRRRSTDMSGVEGKAEMHDLRLKRR